MSDIIVSESRIIPAPAEALFNIMADYEVGHQAVLPKGYFDEVVIKQGGFGAGTEVFVRMTVFGQTYTYNQVISVPEAGRTLVEADLEQSVTTTFSFEPLNEGESTRVTITTTSKASPGIMGMMERLMNPAITKRIYREELQNLEQYALTHEAVPA